MYSIHNEGKSVAVEICIRTLKTKTYKYMTSISKNVCIDKLDHIINEYNSTYIEQLRWNLLMLRIIDIFTQRSCSLIKFKIQFHGHTNNTTK